ncbi:unnamed protein product [Meloidogyne enterolobii]|uniref:Uncharacterized protein n=1 Tax=Meloidogyne enterolobii TaxID=390850 RepID=A0ACB0Z323_MELEN
MASVPHGNFVPHSSPLSVSYSYGPRSSPMPQNNEKNKDAEVCYTNDADIQNQRPPRTLPNPLKNLSAQKNSRSILKNPSEGRGESQERRGFKHGSNQSLASNSEKKSVNNNSNRQPVQRKETLKTVAFGLTTKLEETVLGKEGKVPATPRDGNKTKTIIFSHEAQSLHKLVSFWIQDQKHQIETLRDTIEDLRTEQENQRVGSRELIDIISALATRLQEVEKQKTTANTSLPAISNLSLKNSSKKDLPTKSAPTKVDKATSIENVPNNQEVRQNKENRGNPGDLVLHQRNDFLRRLESEMTKNPVFEQRLHSMLRVWSEDSSVPPAIYSKNNNLPQENEESCGPSMVMRVTTQRQEIFYTSPGRCSNNVRRFPRAENIRDGDRQRHNFRREREENNHNNTKPNIKVVELDDDGEEKENSLNEEINDHQRHQTMSKNVRRSEQIGTDEAAEFFPQRQSFENENDEDDGDEFFVGGDHQERRGRERGLLIFFNFCG